MFIGCIKTWIPDILHIDIKVITLKELNSKSCLGWYTGENKWHEETGNSSKVWCQSD